MTRSEFPYYFAVWKIYTNTDEPGADFWINDPAKTREIRHRVLLQLDDDFPDFCPSALRIPTLWINLRKTPVLRMICEIVDTYGSHCFFAGRERGPCSDDLTPCSLLSGKKNGDYKDFKKEHYTIACYRHNADKGSRSIEDYLLSPYQNNMTEGRQVELMLNK